MLDRLRVKMVNCTCPPDQAACAVHIYHNTAIYHGMTTLIINTSIALALYSLIEPCLRCLFDQKVLIFRSHGPEVQDKLWSIVIHPLASLGGSVGCTSDWWSGGYGFDSRQVQLHSFMETDHELFSVVILSLSLFQKGQFSVSGKECTQILVRSPKGGQHSFAEIWSWNIFCRPSLPSTDSRRAVSGERMCTILVTTLRTKPAQ